MASQGWIAFAGVHWTDASEPVGSVDLYLVHPDGSGLHRLLRGAVSPAWSPDGTRIAFGRTTPPGARIYEVSARGGALRALTSPAGTADQPAFSPDGRLLAFTKLPRKVPGRNCYAQQVHVLSLRTGAVRRLSSFARFAGGAGSPVFSPDGRRLLFAGRTSSAEGARSDVWEVRPDGRGLRRLLARADEPAFSPDGGTLAFVRRGDIYLATADGTGVRRLTATPHDEDSHPSFSPDGSELAFASLHRRSEPSRDDLRIAVVRLDDGARRELTDASPRFWADAPAWQPVG